MSVSPIARAGTGAPSVKQAAAQQAAAGYQRPAGTLHPRPQRHRRWRLRDGPHARAAYPGARGSENGHRPDPEGGARLPGAAALAVAGAQAAAPELPYPENFYTYHRDFHPMDVLNDVQRQIAAVGQPPRDPSQAYSGFADRGIRVHSRRGHAGSRRSSSGRAEMPPSTAGTTPWRRLPMTPVRPRSATTSASTT